MFLFFEMIPNPVTVPLLNVSNLMYRFFFSYQNQFAQQRNEGATDSDGEDVPSCVKE